VQPAPHKEVGTDIKRQFEGKTINLDALY